MLSGVFYSTAKLESVCIGLQFVQGPFQGRSDFQLKVYNVAQACSPVGPYVKACLRQVSSTNYKRLWSYYGRYEEGDNIMTSSWLHRQYQQERTTLHHMHMHTSAVQDNKFL